MEAPGQLSGAPDPDAAAAGAGGSAGRERLEPVGVQRADDLPRRLASRARQPQPVHRAPRPGLRDLAPQLRLPRRFRGQGPLAQARARRELDGLAGRQDLDVQDPPGRQVAGRPAADRQGRGVHLQLHRQERPADPGHLHRRHHRRRGHRRLHGRHHHREAEVQHARHGRADHPRAHLEQGQRQGGDHHLPERAADHRLRPLPDRRVEPGQVHPHGRQQGLLGRQAQGRRALLRELQERRHHDRRPQAGRHRRGGRAAAGAVPVRAEDRRRDRAQGHPLALQRAGLQLLRLAGLDGQPRAARSQVPPGAQLGDRPPEDRRRRLLRPGRRGLHAHRAVLARTTGSRPPTRPTSTTPKRPRRSSTSPATRTRTATASARPRTASR